MLIHFKDDFAILRFIFVLFGNEVSFYITCESGHGLSVLERLALATTAIRQGTEELGARVLHIVTKFLILYHTEASSLFQSFDKLK